ncbi:hypothetical protein ACWIUD_08445 [Helicobacter sp. 23-1044]
MDNGLLALLGFLLVLLVIAYLVALVVSWWKIFEKGGEEGWAAIVPFYNAYILGKVAGGVGFGVGFLVVVMIQFFGIIMGLVVVSLTGEEDAYALIVILFALPFLIMRLVLAFKLGGKFGCGVGIRFLLAIPYINFIAFLYLAFSKNCVYSEQPKEASVGWFIVFLLTPLFIIFLLFMAVAVPRFTATGMRAQVSIARSDLASAQKAIVAKVFADNIDVNKRKAPNGKDWGEWIMEIAELDESRWKAGNNGIYAIGTDEKGKKRKLCKDISGLPVLWINPRDGNMHFNPSRLSDDYDKDDFCSYLRMSYTYSGGNYDRIIPLASTGSVEW